MEIISRSESRCSFSLFVSARNTSPLFEETISLAATVGLFVEAIIRAGPSQYGI